MSWVSQNCDNLSTVLVTNEGIIVLEKKSVESSSFLVHGVVFSNLLAEISWRHLFFVGHRKKELSSQPVWLIRLYNKMKYVVSV